MSSFYCLGDLDPFRSKDEWAGGYYELMLLVPSRMATEAVSALWSRGDFDGCYLERAVARARQVRLAPATLSEAEATRPLYGLVRIEASSWVACQSYGVADGAGDATWISFGFPMQSLSRVYPVGAYPFESGGAGWREALDERLLRLALWTPVADALMGSVIGWEPNEEDLDQCQAGVVPVERWIGFLVREAGQLRWYGTNQGPQLASARS
jgi:hypothetical protein